MGGCFGGALGSGLPPFRCAAPASSRSASDRAPPDCSRSSFVKSASCSAEMCLAQVAALAHLRQQQLQLPVARHERRHHREHVVRATLPQQFAPDVERRPAKLTLARRLLVLVAHGSSMNHSDDPCQRAPPTRFLRFRQPVARDAGSHRVALRPGLPPALRAASTVRARRSLHPRRRRTHAVGKREAPTLQPLVHDRVAPARPQQQLHLRATAIQKQKNVPAQRIETDDRSHLVRQSPRRICAGSQSSRAA